MRTTLADAARLRTPMICAVVGREAVRSGASPRDRWCYVVAQRCVGSEPLDTSPRKRDS